MAVSLPVLRRNRTLLENQIDRVKAAHARVVLAHNAQIVDLHRRLEIIEQQIIAAEG